MNMSVEPIKILLTIPNFDTAGSGKVVYDLARGIDKSKFDVHIACSNSNGQFFEEVKKLNLPIHIIETTQKLRPYYSLLSRIKPYKDFIKKHKFDIVHSWHWSSDWTEIIATRLAGAKYVYTKKAMSWGNIHWKIKSLLANFIITINEDMSSFFSYKKNTLLIPLGIDTNFYEPNKANINQSNTFKIITVANLVPVKGIEILIESLTLVDKTDIELIILGDDSSSYAFELKCMVHDLNLREQVSFYGKKSNVLSFLQISDLYVIPSYNEGMPMALVEAMSTGVPVLGSDISGIKYVLKDFKELRFKTGDRESLAFKINQFINMDGKEREALGIKLREYVESNFSMKAFIQKHQDLYLSLI